MASKYQKLQNKHVLIIGGTSGIGFAVAEGSLASGARVTISSSSQSRVDAAVEKLKAGFPNSTSAGHVCDLSKPTVEADIEALFAKVGAVDHIVYTAGDRLATVSIPDITYEKILAAGQVRFVAPMLLAKVASRYLSPGPSSSITLTTGAVSQKPMPDWSVVAAYAAGLHGLTRNLALDLKPVRVNLVSPGFVDTALWDSHDEKDREKILQSVVEKVPTGRVAQPEDVAEAFLFLMKDANATGTVVDSNSGSLLV
ncbi:Tropinone reductase-like 3 [Cytospora mali]|uniref:Tropinone reductase-like 3 n=1 Tax=Cytospora mali TaxID=578113 RepID=A0A194WCI1_CYTMA|nr:Tropinone reductase-like 3 [Valsa mali]